MVFYESAACFKLLLVACSCFLTGSDEGSPIWRTEVFCGEFGDAYVKDSGLEGGQVRILNRRFRGASFNSADCTRHLSLLVAPKVP